MRLVSMFSFAVLAAVAAMALVGATSASANSTKLCREFPDGLLICPQPADGTSVHLVPKAGTTPKLLSPLTVLCLNVLLESSGADIGALGSPQRVDATVMSFTGCGTGSAHDNCSITVETLPDNTLLKVGLDSGSLEALNGSARLVCSNIGINCLYDLEGSLFSVGAQHLTANEVPTTELGGKFVCPNEGFLDGLLETLANVYVLG